ncbi:hypothetical protein PVK06_028413 [Gossypium arboreum]|uniref:Uncharacterized protein n=1 Tax=Gossypium arboreum TaxID=29729 RepID=A0ABR0P4A5_GOSAR|nr:hypothetical protein PVK06_028413 [Gossypium arboreum]
MVWRSSTCERGKWEYLGLSSEARVESTTVAGFGCFILGIIKRKGGLCVSFIDVSERQFGFDFLAKWVFLNAVVGPHSVFTLGSCNCPSILIIISSESSMN